MSDEGIFQRQLRATIEARKDLTASGLSLSAGLDKTTNRQLLNGKTRSLRLDAACKICAALGTTIDRFMAQSPNSLEDRKSETEILRLITELPEPLPLPTFAWRQRDEVNGFVE